MKLKKYWFKRIMGFWFVPISIEGYVTFALYAVFFSYLFDFYSKSQAETELEFYMRAIMIIPFIVAPMFFIFSKTKPKQK